MIDNHLKCDETDKGQKSDGFASLLLKTRTVIVNGDTLRCGKVSFTVAGLPDVVRSSGTFLRFLDDDATIELVPSDVITLGSKSTNGIVIKGREGVSRYHAELIYDEATWWIKDLGARNGVEIDGKDIERAPQHMAGSQTNKDLIVSNLYLEVLVHEIIGAASGKHNHEKSAAGGLDHARAIAKARSAAGYAQAAEMMAKR